MFIETEVSGFDEPTHGLCWYFYRKSSHSQPTTDIRRHSQERAYIALCSSSRTRLLTKSYTQFMYRKRQRRAIVSEL